VSADLLPVSWLPREIPLTPRAVAAGGASAYALARRLLGRSDEALLRLSGVAGEGLIVVLGPAEELPWVDGVSYLGQEPKAPGLLLPTNLAPDAPLPLVAGALLARGRGLVPPVAVLLSPPQLVGAGRARPLRRERVEAWLGG
jgi:hypothetical protein